jgi:hypothetical protein
MGSIVNKLSFTVPKSLRCIAGCLSQCPPLFTTHCPNSNLSYSCALVVLCNRLTVLTARQTTAAHCTVVCGKHILRSLLKTVSTGRQLGRHSKGTPEGCHGGETKGICNGTSVGLPNGNLNGLFHGDSDGIEDVRAKKVTAM